LNYRHASPGDEVAFVMALPRELDRIGPVHRSDTVVYVREDGDEGEAAQPVSVESKMSRSHKVERIRGPDFGLDDSPSSKKRMGFAHMDIPVHCGLSAQRSASAGGAAQRWRRAVRQQERRGPGPLHAVVGPLLAATEQLFDREPDVARDLAEKRGRDVVASVERNCRPTPVGVPILPVRPTLPDLLKPEPHEVRRHFTRLQNRD